MQPGVVLVFIENSIMTLLSLTGSCILNRLDKYTHLSSWFSLAGTNFVVNRPVFKLEEVPMLAASEDDTFSPF